MKIRCTEGVPSFACTGVAPLTTAIEKGQGLRLSSASTHQNSRMTAHVILVFCILGTAHGIIARVSRSTVSDVASATSLRPAWSVLSFVYGSKSDLYVCMIYDLAMTCFDSSCHRKQPMLTTHRISGRVATVGVVCYR